MKSKSILIVDDDEDILEFLKYNFLKSGYRVFIASRGQQGIEIAHKEKPDIIILDIMMEGIDGIEVCTQLKEIGKSNDSLIMFLTARGEDYTQIAGFEAGADDFVTKPINPKVLIKRVEALLRRKIKSEESNNTDSLKIIEIGGFSLNREKYEVRLNNMVIGLARKEFNLLELLISKTDKVFTREEIFDSVWGDTFVGDRTIDVHIRKLREKLGEGAITTIKGIGYKINVAFFEK